MNLFQKIKLLWKVKGPIEETIKEATKMDENKKPGWKTTEFYMTLLTNIITVVGTLKNIIPADTAAVIIAVANGIYGVLRTVAKKEA